MAALGMALWGRGAQGQAGGGGDVPTVRIVGPSSPSAEVSPAVKVKKTTQMRGFTMRLENPDFFDKYMQAIDDLADMGCTWINLTFCTYQEDVHSVSIPTAWDKNLARPKILQVMAKAKSRGMGIMLMPVVLLRNTGTKDWRGIISPQKNASGVEDWDGWFASYTRYITEMATLAQEGDVDIFAVGSELLSTEPLRDRWVKTIGKVREAYKGKLTYSANWDHYESVTFWDQVDYIGMNNYYELSNSPGATPTQLAQAWKKIREPILAFAVKQKKPFMFTEVGYHNLKCTLSQPWNYVAEGDIDLEEQKHGFESFVAAWKDVPNSQFMGAFVWEWYADGAVPQGKLPARGTYSLQGTPSLDVMQKWFKMPG